MKTIQNKQQFLESKGIKVGNIEGDDFSTVFHISSNDRKKIEDNLSEYEAELDCYFAPSDMFGMNVVIIENKEA